MRIPSPLSLCSRSCRRAWTHDGQPWQSLSVVVVLAALSGPAVTVTTASATANPSAVSIWPASPTPDIPANGDGSANELGVKFRADLSGTVTGLRYYKGAGNTGTHVAHLWNSSRTQLAAATFVDESASGWQTVSFATPVAVVAGATYVASYFAPSGHYASTANYFATGGAGNAPLHALATGVDGSNGVYHYGSSGFPTSTYAATNYWVDVIFNVATLPAPSSVTVTGASPTSVTVSWADGPNETNYVVQRSPNGSTGWAMVGTVAADATTFVDAGLSGATRYWYRILAANAAGTSPPSTVVVVTTQQAACTGVPVAAGASIQAAIDANPPGSTLCLANGVYRPTSAINPKAGDALVGTGSTVISGSLTSTSWTAAGTAWYASGLLPAPYSDANYNPCQDTTTNLCKFDEWLFRDDTPLRRVAALSALTRGTFYADYAANRVYIGDSPVGHHIELSSAKTAIESTASNVTLQGLLIEKFATWAQHGAVVANADGWVISDCDIRFNHGAGLYIYGSNVRVLTSHIHHNGTLGVAVHAATGIVVDGNQLDHNNTDGSMVNDGENGGYKSTGTSDIVRNNNVHDNEGMGLWFDIDDRGNTIERNTITNNAASGIRYEISYNGIIRYNVLNGNGMHRQQGNGSLYYGAGIDIGNSSGVDVHDNTVTGSDNGIGLVMQNRGSGAYGTWQLTNVHVYGNTVRMASGATGLVQSLGDTSYYTGMGNSFSGNTYHLPNLTGRWFNWMDAAVTPSQWTGFGQDSTVGMNIG